MMLRRSPKSSLSETSLLVLRRDVVVRVREVDGPVLLNPPIDLVAVSTTGPEPAKEQHGGKENARLSSSQSKTSLT